VAQALEVDAEVAAEDHTTVPELVLEEREIRATGAVIPGMLAVLLAVVVWAELAETLQMEEVLPTAGAESIIMALCMLRAVVVDPILKALVVVVTEAEEMVELIVITATRAEETLVAVAVAVDAAARRVARAVRAK
jgi:hypothetical protein